ncbi:MAG: hypothetical protein H5T61_14020, partial [Thermoflexales bacterium]|nr:hypothetical protein [Thermoflexales bacterium]
WGIAASRGQLGRVAELEGEYHTAIQLWARALATFEELGTPEREIVLRWFARLRERMGKKKFERLLREALGKPAPE